MYNIIKYQKTRFDKEMILSQATPLSFYLLKPVKRVTEYPLLVDKLLKNTPTDHPDYPYLQEANTRARTLCDQVLYN